MCVLLLFAVELHLGQTTILVSRYVVPSRVLRVLFFSVPSGNVQGAITNGALFDGQRARNYGAHASCHRRA